jgi:hypothetical protein
MDQLAWMFSLIPDVILEALIHITLVAGIVLAVLGTFSSKFPFVGEYGRLAKLVGIPLFLLGVFLEGGLVTEMKWRAKADELKAQVEASEAKSKETNIQIQKVYVDRVKTVKEVQIVIQERIKEVTKKIDAECKVAPEAVSILNDAAKLRKGTVTISPVSGDTK